MGRGTCIMKIFQIGLGSMGKRRIRNLHSLNINDIVGFDLRKDRMQEAQELFNIELADDCIEAVKNNNFDAVIISVPPDVHIEYIQMAQEYELPCFVEASVVDDGFLEVISKQQTHRSLIAPSCTMRFHPSIKLIFQFLKENKIGKISNFHYHFGNYLPDWHPWESIHDFYVSNPRTGGAREIVSFELTWLNWLFGDLNEIKGFFGKTIDMGAPISDTYAAAVRYKNGIMGTFIVDVVARKSMRQLVINGELGHISWDWDERCVKLFIAGDSEWGIYKEPEGHAENGYNQNIVEEMYIEELKTFLKAVTGETKFPNTMQDDYKILQWLYKLEESDSR